MFAYTKILNVGSTHPIIARIAIGLPEIVKLAKLSEDQKQDIVTLLHKLSRDLIEVERRALIVIREIEGIEHRKKEQNNPNFFESVEELTQAIDFVAYATSAIRSTTRIVGTIFNRKNEQKKWDKYKNGRLDDIAKELAAELSLPEDALILVVLKTYEPWYKQLNLIGMEDRHPNLEDYLVNYGYNSMPYFRAGGCFTGDDIPVYEFLKVSLEYLFPFCEMLMLSALLELLSDMFTVIEIAEEHRNPACPKRFKVSLAAHEDYLWQQQLVNVVLVLQQLLLLYESMCRLPKKPTLKVNLVAK